MLAVGATIVVFILGCGTILLLVALSRAWRAASAYEQMQAAAAFEGVVNGYANGNGNGHHAPEAEFPVPHNFGPRVPVPPGAGDEATDTAPDKTAPRQDWASR
jgi:hypothetical protein